MSFTKLMSDHNFESSDYSRDSFDRFGDDLSELILSYLSLKDKFRYECVAKQWRRLVFTKKTESIHYDEQTLYENIFNYKILIYFSINRSVDQTSKLLPKCPNINFFTFFDKVFARISAHNSHRSLSTTQLNSLLSGFYIH